MLVTIHAPKWDKEVEMPAVPRVGDTLVAHGVRWTVTDVVWWVSDDFDNDCQSVHLTVDPKLTE